MRIVIFKIFTILNIIFKGFMTIDLRSDTVTRPTEAMKQAMLNAEVGDDVFGEDPSINALQKEVAELFGKEAALFVPTGTMANQVAIKAHTRPGDEVIAHQAAHIIRAESGAAAVLSGVQFRTTGKNDGTFDPEEVEAALYTGDNPHFPPTGLIAMENTHNFQGGAVVPLENMALISEIARKHSIPFHLDGARVLNAAVALDVQAETIARNFDTMTLCFSKGLGCPVGSVIMGPQDFITRCLRYRKMFGGGMRQAGYLAEAARYALKNNVTRLAEDHAHATQLANAFKENPHIKNPYGPPQTNILFFSVEHPKINTGKFVAEMGRRGVKISMSYGNTARIVTHLGVSSEEINQVAQTAKDLLSQAS